MKPMTFRTILMVFIKNWIPICPNLHGFFCASPVPLPFFLFSNLDKRSIKNNDDFWTLYSESSYGLQPNLGWVTYTFNYSHEKWDLNPNEKQTKTRLVCSSQTQLLFSVVLFRDRPVFLIQMYRTALMMDVVSAVTSWYVFGNGRIVTPKTYTLGAQWCCTLCGFSGSWSQHQLSKHFVHKETNDPTSGITMGEGHQKDV